ncbi:MAG: hypothetical protein Q9163_002956 [Psora crenata]
MALQQQYRRARGDPFPFVGENLSGSKWDLRHVNWLEIDLESDCNVDDIFPPGQCLGSASKIMRYLRDNLGKPWSQVLTMTRFSAEDLVYKYLKYLDEPINHDPYAPSNMDPATPQRAFSEATEPVGATPPLSSLSAAERSRLQQRNIASSPPTIPLPGESQFSTPVRGGPPSAPRLVSRSRPPADAGRNYNYDIPALNFSRPPATGDGRRTPSISSREATQSPTARSNRGHQFPRLHEPASPTSPSIRAQRQSIISRQARTDTSPLTRRDQPQPGLGDFYGGRYMSSDAEDASYSGGSSSPAAGETNMSGARGVMVLEKPEVDVRQAAQAFAEVVERAIWRAADSNGTSDEMDTLVT